MSQAIIPRDEAAEYLAVSTRVLVRYEARGLIHAVRVGAVEGYGPAEIQRLQTIVCYQRDLGINLAGVEIALKLRDHLVDVHHRLEDVASRLRLAVEEEGERQEDEPTLDSHA